MSLPLAYFLDKTDIISIQLDVQYQYPAWCGADTTNLRMNLNVGTHNLLLNSLLSGQDKRLTT